MRTSYLMANPCLPSSTSVIFFSFIKGGGEQNAIYKSVKIFPREVRGVETFSREVRGVETFSREVRGVETFPAR